MNQSDETTRLHLWRFVRGDESARVFEHWAYDEPTLEARLGGDLYLELISADFRDAEAVWSLRDRLGAYVRSLPGPDCRCIRLRDLDIVDMGWFRAPAPAFEQDREWSHEDVMGTLVEVRRRSEPYWWLWAARCTACGQGWLVGSEERQNDIFCLQRLDEAELRTVEEQDRWPKDFDSYERLLQIGRDAGRSARFVDPLDSSLADTMADLARARPGIRVSDLARLLNLDIDLAAELARQAEARADVTITFDTEPAR